MGSDYHMNPPQKVYETFPGLTEEEAMEYVIGAMANDWEVTLQPATAAGIWQARIFKGQWV